jgi:hypothetical protein
MAAIVEIHNPDIFCSFWEPENPEAVSQLIGFFRPQLVEIERQDLIRPYLDDLFRFNVHANMPSMSYKFHRVSMLRQAHERKYNVGYDCVIQARTDNLFFETLTNQVHMPVGSPGIYCSNKSINSAIDPYIQPRMVDNFYLGDPASMDLAASTFWHLRGKAQQYTDAGLLHHVRIPEIIQSQIWQDLGISINTLQGSSKVGDFPYEIDRRETQWK